MVMAESPDKGRKRKAGRYTHAETAMSTSPQASSSWPGDRDPSHDDVAAANEYPDPDFLSVFKRSLLSSGDAAGAKTLLHINLRDRELPSRNYTYPLALLSRFPKLPTDERLDHLLNLFSRDRLHHIFFNHLPAHPRAREPIVPPLRFGIACLASVCSRGDPEEAQSLFSAASSLWPVMVEVDNVLARSVEVLLASFKAVLIIPYGVLADTEYLQKRSTLILSSSLTVARRMRLHHPQLLEPGLRQQASSYSPLLWTLWMWDVIQALHSNLPLNFSSNELFSTMPSSTLPFQDVYRNLLEESKGDTQTLPTTIGSGSREQATLLLLAILSSLVTIRRSLGSSANVIGAAQSSAYRHDPFAPLSAHTELERMQGQLSIALDRWHKGFGASAGPEIMALYRYCGLYLSCATIQDLPRLARYQTGPDHLASQSDTLSAPEDMSNIPDDSVNRAWALLDVAAACTKSEQHLCPVWMPVVVFHAALVVWAKTCIRTGNTGNANGSVRSLLAFKVELEAMPWPCCTPMAATLQTLMAR